MALRRPNTSSIYVSRKRPAHQWSLTNNQQYNDFILSTSGVASRSATPVETAPGVAIPTANTTWGMGTALRSWWGCSWVFKNTLISRKRRTIHLPMPLLLHGPGWRMAKTAFFFTKDKTKTCPICIYIVNERLDYPAHQIQAKVINFQTLVRLSTLLYHNYCDIGDPERSSYVIIYNVCVQYGVIYRHLATVLLSQNAKLSAWEYWADKNSSFVSHCFYVPSLIVCF